eukprot:12358723-Ditylum_brightwellii.AAC.1
MKETVTFIGYITKIHPMHIDRVHCQEQLNEAVIVVVTEVATGDTSYFLNFGTMLKTVNFKAKIKPVKPSIVVDATNIKPMY